MSSSSKRKREDEDDEEEVGGMLEQKQKKMMKKKTMEVLGRCLFFGHGIGEKEAKIIRENGGAAIRDERGRCALHYAADGQNLEAVQTLLSVYPEGEWIRDKDGCTPFALALKRGAFVVFRYFLNSDKAHAAECVEGDVPALHFAAYYGSREACEVILSAKPDEIYRGLSMYETGKASSGVTTVLQSAMLSNTGRNEAMRFLFRVWPGGVSSGQEDAVDGGKNSAVELERQFSQRQQGQSLARIGSCLYVSTTASDLWRPPPTKMMSLCEEAAFMSAGEVGSWYF